MLKKNWNPPSGLTANVHDFAWFVDPAKENFWLGKSQRKVPLWSINLLKNAKL